MPEQEQSKNTQRSVSTEAFVTCAPDVDQTVPEPAAKRLVWRGSGISEGEAIDYDARAAHLEVRSDNGTLLGHMFSLSYVADVEGDRPVTFCYNGGPGCASVPINFGGIGPRRVETDGTNHLGHDNAVVDNPATLLRQSDLVFLDALGTGFSMVADGANTNQIFGIDGDADAFCRAILTWLEENGRWSSPVYLFGESYGTVRNAVLMRLLGERGVHVTGVVMLSAIFDWVQTLPGSDLYYLGMMPTYAATAQFFGVRGQGRDVDEWFDEAMAFDEEVLAPALLLGDRLGREREAEVAHGLSGFIGLPEDLLMRHHLRVELDDFRRNLLLDRGKVTGRLDMRFASDAPATVQRSSDWFAAEDAADDAVDAAWTAAFRSFLHELGYRAPARYLSNNYPAVGAKWNWEHEVCGTGDKVSAPNVAYDIATALRRSPKTRVAILGGRYDAATTWWNVVHDISCQFLSPELRANVEFYRYGCGHMAYVDVPTLETMAHDMEEFYR